MSETLSGSEHSEIQRQMSAAYVDIKRDLWNRLKTLATVSFNLILGDLVSARDAMIAATEPMSEYPVLMDSGSGKIQQITESLVLTKYRKPDFKMEAQASLDNSRIRNYGLWDHYKGPIYPVIVTSIEENTLTPMVTYHSPKYNLNWTRTLENFTEKVTLSDGTQVPRFKRHFG